VEKLVDQLLPIEPPTWRRCWLNAGRVLHEVFADHEEVGLARLQNDVLLALTALYTGTTLVTMDAHFSTLRQHVPFTVVRG
jgi:predicted nucleic acid-binding protein